MYKGQDFFTLLLLLFRYKEECRQYNWLHTSRLIIFGLAAYPQIAAQSLKHHIILCSKFNCIQYNKKNTGRPPFLAWLAHFSYNSSRGKNYGMRLSVSFCCLYLSIMYNCFHFICNEVKIYRVFRKNCVFFTIHCNHSLAYIAVKDLQSSQRECTVTLIGW